ncbi:MAG: hypothetical protein GEU94_22185 [Micromonosporaceae bacterium]|nr:hypothetical protein [Micromonosporaceae bacterium]
MRRAAAVAVLATLTLSVFSAPAYGFAHDRVARPYLHLALDVLTLAVITAPLWTTYLWGGERRVLLLALVALVQAPVALAGFTPILDPGLHAAVLVSALGLTAAALWFTRHAAAPVPAVSEADAR